MKTAETIDNWNDHWNTYAESARINPAQSYRRKLILSLLNLNDQSSGVRLLDIGSGQGDFALDLKTTFPKAEILGLELSQSGVDISKKKVPTGTFLQRNLLEPQTPPDSHREWATHAVCSEVLEHVEEPEMLLENVKPYLAPNARLVLTVPGGPRSAFDKHIGHRVHYTPESFRHLLEKAGYEVEFTSGAGFPFFNLYKMVVIARGQKLIQDVAGQGTEKMPASAKLAMSAFDLLFKMNLDRSSFGWQVVAVARKRKGH